jgi:hypothetical protein
MKGSALRRQALAISRNGSQNRHAALYLSRFCVHRSR